MNHNLVPLDKTSMCKCAILFALEDMSKLYEMFAILIFQDRFLPIANVARIMKKSIPNTGKVSL